MTDNAPRSSLVASIATSVLVIVSVLLTLAVGEVGIRMAGFQPIFDVYSKPSLFWVHDELLGWSHQPNTQATYVGPRPWPIQFETPISINSIGLRGPEVSPSQPGELRVLVLGDSIVAAFEVAREDTFVFRLARLLERRLNRPVTTINAGVRGYGTDQSYLYYRERGHLLKPDIVILIHSHNDPRNNITLHRMRRPFGKAAFALREDGELEIVGHPVTVYPACSAWVLGPNFQRVRRDDAKMRLACRLQMKFADHSALFTFLALRIRQNPELLRRLYRLGAPPTELLGDGLESRFRLTVELFHRLQQAATGHGSRFAVLISDWDLEEFDIEEMRARGIQTSQLSSAAIEGVDPLSIQFKNDSHYNEAGHELVAELLEQVVLDMIANVPPA